MADSFVLSVPFFSSSRLELRSSTYAFSPPRPSMAPHPISTLPTGHSSAGLWSCLRVRPLKLRFYPFLFILLETPPRLRLPVIVPAAWEMTRKGLILHASPQLCDRNLCSRWHPRSPSSFPPARPQLLGSPERGQLHVQLGYPLVRDVVSTGPDTTDNVTIRFMTDNAGPWFLHCHIDFHLELGLAIVFAEDTDTIANSVHPSAWDTLCPTYDALTSPQLGGQR
ncbi:Bilirubin oxidase [Mycena sanguinolenta]|uniref:Bilirubin oxidase n=1 Tax=Mycena sanguinolenta TaxID=230812 RepID=A0A8H7DLD3_9AGAR|nr:Bilirubin oxidase [Mycena sanguinolenta]